MESPMSLYQADLIEIGNDQLQYHMEGWILSGYTVSEDIKAFVKWCIEQNKETLHCKRGKDGKSFYERREEARPS